MGKGKPSLKVALKGDMPVARRINESLSSQKTTK